VRNKLQNCDDIGCKPLSIVGPTKSTLYVTRQHLTASYRPVLDQLGHFAPVASGMVPVFFLDYNIAGENHLFMESWNRNSSTPYSNDFRHLCPPVFFERATRPLQPCGDRFFERSKHRRLRFLRGSTIDCLADDKMTKRLGGGNWTRDRSMASLACSSVFIETTLNRLSRPTHE
jgi:hypothetical protein